MSAELTPQNTLLYLAPVSMRSNALVFKRYAELRHSMPESDIYIIIRTDGGDYGAAMQASEIFSKDKHLHAIVIFAASGGALMSQSVGGKTYIVPRGQLMFHQAKLEPYEGRWYSWKDLKEAYEDLKDSNTKFLRACNVKMKLIDIEAKTQGDWFLKAPEALKLKAADAINTQKCSARAAAQNVTIPIFDSISGVEIPTNVCDLL